MSLKLCLYETNSSWRDPEDWGEEEKQFVKVFCRTANNAIPLLSVQILAVGLRALEKETVDVTPEDRDACVTLTWCACAFGAAMLNDPRCVMYCAKARSSLQTCFQYSTILVVRAFFAVEIVRRASMGMLDQASNRGHNKSSKSSSSSSSSSSSVRPEHRRPYVAMGIAMLKTLKQEASLDCAVIILANFVLTTDFLAASAVGDNYAASSHFRKVAFFKIRDMQVMESELHLAAHCITIRSQLSDVSRRLWGTTSNTDLSVPFEPRRFSLSATILEGALASNISVNNPIAYFFLTFTACVHSVEIGDVERGLAGFQTLAEFVSMQPWLLCEYSVWFCAYHLLKYVHIAQNEARRNSRVNAFERAEVSALPTIDCLVLGRVLLNSMTRLMTNNDWGLDCKFESMSDASKSYESFSPFATSASSSSSSSMRMKCNSEDDVAAINDLMDLSLEDVVSMLSLESRERDSLPPLRQQVSTNSRKSSMSSSAKGSVKSLLIRTQPCPKFVY